MKEKVLITGASGFVGFHLIEAALAKGLEVHAAVRRSSDIRHLTAHDVKYVYPNYTSKEELERELNEHQYDYIIHAAGSTKAKNQEEYNRINAELTINLANAAAKTSNNLKKFVFISSLAAIGPLKQATGLITEDAVPQPVTSYGKSKLLAEEKLKEINLPTIVFRPTAVYGSRDKDIFIIIKTFSRGLEPYIGRTAQQLSFIYGKDLAELSVKALFTANDANGAYNITDGKCYNRYEFANITKEVLKRKTFKFHLPLGVVKGLAMLMEKTYGMFDKTPALNIEKLHELTAVNWCCDIEKAKNKLSFNPKYDLKTGLTEALGWYKENKWL